MRPIRSLLLAFVLLALPALAAAEELRTQAGVLQVPEGFTLLDRNEDPPKDGSPSGLFVFGRSADPLPRAIYILTFAKPQPGPEQTIAGQAEAAALMANPMDPRPNLRKAKPARIGEADATRYSTTLDNGLVSTTYVADHLGLRFVALLKHPPGRDYVRDTARFEQALQGFQWSVAAAAPEAETAAAAAAPAEAPEAGTAAAAAAPAATQETGAEAPPAPAKGD